MLNFSKYLKETVMINDSAMGWVASLVFAVVSIVTWGGLLFDTVKVFAAA
jgi:hypothetical protein